MISLSLVCLSPEQKTPHLIKVNGRECGGKIVFRQSCKWEEPVCLENKHYPFFFNMDIKKTFTMKIGRKYDCDYLNTIQRHMKKIWNEECVASTFQGKGKRLPAYLFSPWLEHQPMTPLGV